MTTEGERVEAFREREPIRKERETMPRPLIIAHRGASSSAPENTLAAFEHAIEAGADGAEFDVRLSGDGVPVVIHDATLRRTAGIKERVADLTAQQLSRVDVGSWFNAAHPAKARSDFASERIASLHTVLQTVERLAGPIYVEIKCEADRDVSRLVEAVCREIEASPVRERIILKSFRLGVIPQARTALPGVRTAALFAPDVMRLLRKEKYLIDIAQEFGADDLSVHRSLASRKLVKKAWKRGIPVTVWTVNSTRWIAKAEKRGVYAVITDDPAKLLANRE